jgi:hypothetical protein
MVAAQRINMRGGIVATVDADDYALVSRHVWRPLITKRGIYAQTWIGKGSDRRCITMHRLILGTAAGEKVDHRDGNGLNNRRSNLRPATTSQNAQNARRHRDGASGYKGVYWSKGARKWMAKLVCDGKQIHLGYHADKEAAARAYDRGARLHFGEFARCNFTEV